MYNNIYQEYINNIIGQMPENSINFVETAYNNSGNKQYFQNRNDSSNLDLEQFYPDLYKLIYPMIQTACMRNTKPLTKENIDEMVKDIYSNFVSDDITILNINLTNDVRSSPKTTATSNEKANVKTAQTNKVPAKNSNEKRNVENVEVRDLRPNNYVLNDLIRILLIRELLGRPGNVIPTRPPFSNTIRPPFRNSEINFDMQNYSIYENPINMYSNFNEGYNIF